MTPQPPDAFVEVRMRRRASYRRTLWLSVRMHQFSAFCGILSLALSVLLMVGTGNEPPLWSLALSMALGVQRPRAGVMGEGAHLPRGGPLGARRFGYA